MRHAARGSGRLARGVAALALAASMTGAGVIACSGTASRGQAGPDPASEPVTWVYTCADGFRFSARLQGDSAVIGFGEGSKTLTRSGARYEAPGATFRVPGYPADVATLETSGAGGAGAGQHSDCRGVRAGTPWEEAALLGVDFRAIGQEPGWLLELDHERWLRFLGDYGEMRVLVPAPAAERRSSSGTVTYTARIGTDTLVVTAREAACQDAMSGERFSHQVTVRTGSRAFTGCGRPVMTGDLLGAYWKLTDVGGVPAVPPRGGREAHLRFVSGGRQVSGSTGCRALSAPVVLGRQRLRIGAVVATRSACATPDLSRQERELLAALEAADRFAVADEHLTLYHGDRRLARFVAVYLR